MRRLALLAFIWGWSFLFIKVAVEGMTPSTVAWARVTLGALVLQLLLRRRRHAARTGIDALQVRNFAFVALSGSVVPFTLLAWGEQHITSALTAVLNASTPLFTALFAAVVGLERLRPAQLLGLGVGLSGVAIAAGLGTADLAGSSLAGTVAAVGAACCYGVAFVFTRRHLTGIPPLRAAAGQLTAAAVILAPFALVTSAREGVALTPTRIAAITILGAVGTGIAYVLNYGLIGELGATKASLVTYLIPVIAVVVGIVVLGEPFEWRLILGGIITIGGIAAVTAGRRTPSPEPTGAGAAATAGAGARV
jgi:drug/metabolite transporter (DMT)-like permease